MIGLVFFSSLHLAHVFNMNISRDIHQLYSSGIHINLEPDGLGVRVCILDSELVHLSIANCTILHQNPRVFKTW